MGWQHQKLDVRRKGFNAGSLEIMPGRFDLLRVKTARKVGRGLEGLNLEFRNGVGKNMYIYIYIYTYIYIYLDIFFSFSADYLVFYIFSHTQSPRDHIF